MINKKDCQIGKKYYYIHAGLPEEIEIIDILNEEPELAELYVKFSNPTINPQNIYCFNDELYDNLDDACRFAYDSALSLLAEINLLRTGRKTIIDTEGTNGNVGQKYN